MLNRLFKHPQPILLFVAVTLFTSTITITEADAEDFTEARMRFERAYSELKTGPGPQYLSLRESLHDYPLALYLDYEVLLDQLHTLKPDGARRFMGRAEGTPLKNRFLAAYLEHKGRDRHWREYLAVLDAPPRDTQLQCFYYRALRDTGSKAEAWAGARRLWNVGRSQDDACDPLFDRWMKNAGGPDDELVWSRALKAFDQRALHIVKYVRRFASAQLRPMLDELIKVYRYPDSLVADAHEPSNRHAALMEVGIRRLARVNPEMGRQALLNAIDVQPFTPAQVNAIEVIIARHSLFAQSAAPEAWLISTLQRLADDELTEIYLRKQVEEGHWSALLEGLAWLSDAAQERDQWRYWLARAQEELGQTDSSTLTFASLARERSYHGFLAADKLGLPYQLNIESPEPGREPSDPGLIRVAELLALDRAADARLEWRLVVMRASATEQVALAQFALNRGWSSFAIDAANTAEAWDLVTLRFPPAFEEEFSRAAQQVKLEPEELMAIARRESALYPLAQSRVGARGLMQVMPATGRQVARREGLSWRQTALYEPGYNVDIGSRYYRSLLDRFDGHRPKALAGYNAGPHRVDRWSRDIPVDQWIDSLPFRETREYVQAVLAYTVIYRERAGQSSKLIRSDEWHLTNKRKTL